MARRPDPYQPSMLDALERATPTVTPADDTLVRAYVAAALPPGVPTSIRRVLAVRPYAGGRGFYGERPGYEADVELFDGRSAMLRVSGPCGAASYAWHLPEPDEPFHWDKRRQAWTRLPAGSKAKMRRSRVRHR